jgi:phage FluMu protein Com
MQVVCRKCCYLWEYKGQMKHTVNCPDCGTRNNLKSKIEAQEFETQPPALHNQNQKEVTK